jgi:hypothetical protein
MEVHVHNHEFGSRAADAISPTPRNFAVTTLYTEFTCDEAAYRSTMLVLYETAMGFALFKLTDSAKLTDPDLYKEFETPERANGLCVCIFFTTKRHLFSSHAGRPFHPMQA